MDVFDLERLSETLEGLFDDCGPVVQMLGEGFSSWVVETKSGVVFRIAKNRAAQLRHEREADLLDEIGDGLPVAVPRVEWQVGAWQGLPFGVIGYRKLRGQVVDPQERIDPASVAKFLRALAQVPVDGRKTIDVPGPREFWMRMEAMRDDVLPVLRRMMKPEEYGRISTWWEEFLGDPVLKTGWVFGLNHGDFWYENMLREGDQLCGVLDFEDASIGDQARDFATLLYFGREFVREVAKACWLDWAELEPRVQRYWELRDFGGVQYGVVYQDQEELEDAVRKLRMGPILAG